jgi:hypothetical protein
MKNWKTLALFMALLLVASMQNRPVLAQYTPGAPMFFSAEPVAVTCSNINTTQNPKRLTYNGLETPGSTSPVGEYFNVSIWLRNATLTNVPAGITSIAIDLNFTNILSFAQPVAYTNMLCTPNGVYNTITRDDLLFIMDGLYTNTGVKKTYPFTGATRVMIGCAQTLLPPVPWNGTAGLMATIEFEITSQPGFGSSNATGALNWRTVGTGATTVPVTSYVSFDVVGATITIDAAQTMVHDVAVTGVASSKTAVGRGYSTGVNVTVANRGSFTETFNVTAYANATVIGDQRVSNLNAGVLMTVPFTWNTTGFAYGNYTLSAYASPVPSEANTSDNNFTDGVVKVTIPGDLSGDFKVSLLDLAILANAYGSGPSSAKWNANADINSDSRVSLLDLTILAKYYLQHYP